MAQFPHTGQMLTEELIQLMGPHEWEYLPVLLFPAAFFTSGWHNGLHTDLRNVFRMYGASTRIFP